MKLKDLFEDNVSDGGGSSNSQFFKTYDETKNWLDKMSVENYEINKDTLVVDVSGDVDLKGKKIRIIPVKFGKVSGWFNVGNNKNLKSLVGSPDSSDHIYCHSTGIKNFKGLGNTKNVSAYWIQSLESFEGLPSEMRCLRVEGSCDRINSLNHFPKIVSTRLSIGKDFKWLDTLYKHMKSCSVIIFDGMLEYSNNILKLLYVNDIEKIVIFGNSSKPVSDILNSEIKRQPDPRKRNLLKVAQELSNAGYHHLTV